MENSKNLRVILVLVCLSSIIFSATACVSVGTNIVNFLAYAKGQKTVKDIAFGDLPSHRLNIYIPKEGSVDSAVARALPVIIFFYGGGWSSGDKDDYRFAAEPFTSQGYMVVVPNYSKYPEHRYPQFMEDAALAVSWVKKHIAEYGGDSQTIFLAGHSAGGHIAAMLACNPHFLEQVGSNRLGIRGFVGLAGPYDFVPKEKKYVEIFKPAGGDASSAMPASYVDGTQPPMLLLYGLEDTTVYYSNITSMEKQVAAHGGDLRVKLYDSLDHVSLLTSLTIPYRNTAPVAEDMLAFFESLSPTRASLLPK